MSTGSHKKTILLVEDNPDDEALALRAFRRHQSTHEVEVVRDGQEALDYLFGTGSHAGRDTRNRPTIVLLDLQLPKVHGLDVLKRVRTDHRTKTQPVVILTSSGEERDLAGAYDNHVNSYVRKPVDFEKFIESMRQVGLYWLGLNEPPPAPAIAGA